MDFRYLPALKNKIRQKIEVDADNIYQIWAARPEDVILGKLLAWNEGQSDRHSADIFEMMVYYYLGGLADNYSFNIDYVNNGTKQIGSDAYELWKLINDAAIEEANRIQN